MALEPLLRLVRLRPVGLDGDRPRVLRARVGGAPVRLLQLPERDADARLELRCLGEAGRLAGLDEEALRRVLLAVLLQVCGVRERQLGVVLRDRQAGLEAAPRVVEAAELL